MFQSFSSSKNKITITDSDFQEKVSRDKYFHWVEIIIEVYSKRNLNVAKNLVLFMQYENRKYGDNYSIDYQISRYKKTIKDFDKYLPEINKYLSLI